MFCCCWSPSPSCRCWCSTKKLVDPPWIMNGAIRDWGRFDGHNGGMSREWSESDVYFLEAVGVAEFRGQSDLASVIEIAGSIVHEVLSREEIENSVSRLISARL